MSAARTLPWSWYADPDVLRREHERIFRRTWQYAGHAGRVENLGDPSPPGPARCRCSSCGTRAGRGRLLGENEQLVARLQELVSSALA